MEMVIRRSQSDDLHAIISFLSLFRPPEMQEAEAVYHDTFGHPFSKEEGTSWLAWEGNRLTAHILASPCTAYHKGQPIKANWWTQFFALLGKDGSEGNYVAGQLALMLARQKQGHAVLGTPGTQSKVFSLYKALRFDFWGAVPFFYLVVNGAKVLRELSIFRRNRALALTCRTASYCFVPGKLLQFRHRRKRLPIEHCATVLWSAFPADVDAFWQATYSRYELIFDRSAAYLNWRFHSPIYQRLGIYSDGRLIGWVVCKTTQMKADKWFGNLRVGTIVDLMVDLKSEDNVLKVMSVAVQRLRSNKADLIITNLSHAALMAAASNIGFLQGPSHFLFLTRNLPVLPRNAVHLTRGDSDGDSSL